ncbi:exosortase A [Croceibacterium sp. LX-88]|uniref:Exosortase A n=1 Tax=Croceibacterium selenioxidans TaxID=2838833 RepID=A0ABS5W2C5_9SPHN|nr:exosortase A [Croceibacterium selenioxidans]MBT2133896.1 exosortase A [Croceibacterium selenioxidans]
MPREVTISDVNVWGVLPRAWRIPLLQLTLAWVGLIALTWPDWAEMAHQWWDVSTYNHILLVPAILAWLVAGRWPELSSLDPKAWWPGLGLLGAGLLAWSSGVAADINLVSQLGAVVLLQSAVVTVLGARVSAGLVFPLGYMLFLVPFGDEIVPILQTITAKLAIALTHASDVPATIEGVFIDTPAGLFEVAEACSGVKFLVAMIALGTLVAHLCFASRKRRLAWLAAAAVVPVLANGVRAWGTIYVAQSRGVEFAAGFDHIVYGWFFFAIVMGVLLAASWRFFDRSPEDQLVDAKAIQASPLLSALARLEIGGWRALSFLLFATAVTVAAMDRVGQLT